MNNTVKLSLKLACRVWVISPLLIGTLLTSTFLTNSANAANNKPLRIAVAANFAPVLEKLLPEFTQQTQIPTQVISGATGTLFLQISHGAPFDVFLSADSERPAELKAQQLITANSLHTYALGELALWSSTQKVSLDDLAQLPTTQRFAIANPDTAPYGKAAKQTLQALNVWSHIQTQLVTGINVNQTFQQIRSQAVPLGIVANSQLVLNNLTGIIIPHHLYSEIKQQMVILKTSKQQENALAFSQFLLSDAIQEKIQQLGYAKRSVQGNK